MPLSTQPYKGARDFYPEDKRIQKYMFAKMREVCERFGYEEYDAPILEPTDLYLSKGNQEIIDEQTYTFKDRGDRSVTIRTEMTPTVSRMVAGRRQELAYPVRWYSIPNLWRYERTQRGRLREFWQLNVDIFGVESIVAEHEIILLTDQLLKSYGAKQDMYVVQISSRKLVDYLFGEYLGLGETQRQTLIRLIDRIHKLPYETFVAQADAILTPSQRDAGVLDSLLQLLKARRLEDLPAGLERHESVLKLKLLIGMLLDSRVNNVKFDITLMRGFDYYTDVVFEVSDTDPENNRSMFGGGRYDGLVGLFGVEPIPTVGIAAGDVTLQNFLESHGLLPNLPPETDAYVVLIGDNMYEKVQHSVAELRSMGLNVAVDPGDRDVGKQIKTASKKGIHYAIFVGDAELESGQFKLKNLMTGEEESHGLQRIVTTVKDYRRANETSVDPDDLEDI
ncbi:histidine--tRNA ligase [Candidatus Saccharibacteria bacterium]|nr:MAG: histidine--tRNA ligase [Candidatus Saccharibacteria bacterium]